MYRYLKKQFRYTEQFSEQVRCGGRRRQWGCLRRRSFAFLGGRGALQSRGQAPPSLRLSCPFRQVKALQVSAMPAVATFRTIRNRCGLFVRGEIQIAQSVRLWGGPVALPTAHDRPICHDRSLLLKAVSIKRPIDAGASGLKEIFELYPYISSGCDD